MRHRVVLTGSIRFLPYVRHPEVALVAAGEAVFRRGPPRLVRAVSELLCGGPRPRGRRRNETRGYLWGAVFACEVGVGGPSRNVGHAIIILGTGRTNAGGHVGHTLKPGRTSADFGMNRTLR